MQLRSYATPVVFGAIGISSITGVLLFFHADTGYAKLAHEWLGWLLIVAAVVHVYTNRAAFAAHLNGTKGRVIVVAFAVLIVSAIVPWPTGGGEGGGVEGAGDGGGLLAAEYTLTHTSLESLAPITGRDVDQLVDRLRTAGFDGAAADASIHDFAHGGGQRDRALGVVFGPD